ncbi:tyrosine-protein phosphatase [Pseudonocardia acaciae]|uniref:tyrosine-protein phosphatase n=1 Tax=Pseudonocardia acaciae TaxID=551276 RepID=UPI00048BC323|nr:tyrosine-protein phosphatase [Pseudonocardia acaciae]
MEDGRDLGWSGLYNARDLGGLPAGGGRRTRLGAVVRSATLAMLTEDGWAQLYAYGIRTIIDLTDPDELWPDRVPRPADLTTVYTPLDPPNDPQVEAWRASGLLATPLYFGQFLARFPARVGSAVASVAHARPGGVLFHCVGGRDRTGLVAMVLLAFAGVPAEVIAADHGLSTERLRPLLDRWGEPDQAPMVELLLAEHGTTAREAILAVLRTFEPVGYLRTAGLTEDDLHALRDRLLD